MAVFSALFIRFLCTGVCNRSLKNHQGTQQNGDLPRPTEELQIENFVFLLSFLLMYLFL